MDSRENVYSSSFSAWINLICMLSENIILKELSKIIDPDFNRDIVSLGFIKNLSIDDGNVSFSIELTTPACPYKPIFKKQATDLILDIEDVDNVTINMTARSSQRILKNEDSGLKNVKYILAISSCKGGVGKSTISAIIAKTLSARGFNVGLLDADIYGPSIPTIFNIHKPGIRTSENNKFYPKIVDGLKLMSFGFLMGDGPAVIRGPMVAQYSQQLLHNVLWGDLDYLIIDMPPGTGDIQLTISQSVQIDSSVIVTTPHQLSLTDVRKGIMMFDKVNIPVLGIIENMSYFKCDIGKKYYIFGEAGAKSLNERFGLKTLIELPIIKELNSSYDSIMNSEYSSNTVDEVIRAIGKKVVEKPEMPEINFDQDNISLKWKNKIFTVSNFELRRSCACALCIDEMTRKPLLDPESIPKDIHAKKINTIGNYALLIDWSDGHNTGFFTFKSIKDLSMKNTKAYSCEI